MAKKMKKLLERVEAIEAEIKALRETAEKNVTTISAGIEKLVAASKSVGDAPVKRTRKAPVKKAEPEVKAEPVKETTEKAEVKDEKLARRKPEPVAKEEKPTPESEMKESAPAELKATRTRKPKVAARRRGRASFVLYNCDEEKSPESKYNRNDETFRDSQLGRRGLWNKLKTEIAEGRIELLDGYPIRNVRLDIQSGDPVSVSQHLKYGVIEKVEQKAE